MSCEENASKTAWRLVNFGRLLARRNQPLLAQVLLAQSLSLFHELHDVLGIVLSLLGLATVALHGENHERVVGLVGAAVGLLDANPRLELAPSDIAQRDHDLAEAQARLAESIFIASYRRGHAMTAEQAVKYAQEGARLDGHMPGSFRVRP